MLLAAQPVRSGALACGSVMRTTVVNASCPVRYQNVEKHNLMLHAELALALRRPAQLARVPKHIVQHHLRHGRELVLANLVIDDSSTTRVQPADHRTWGMYSEHDHLEKVGRERERNALWNYSTGVTTTPVMTGSRMTGFVLRYAPRNAPMATTRNASSDESTAWNAPSRETMRTPEIRFPASVPFLRRLKEALFDRGDVVARYVPAHHDALERRVRSRFAVSHHRLDVSDHTRVLPPATCRAGNAVPTLQFARCKSQGGARPFQIRLSDAVS